MKISTEDKILNGLGWMANKIPGKYTQGIALHLALEMLDVERFEKLLLQAIQKTPGPDAYYKKPEGQYNVFCVLINQINEYAALYPDSPSEEKMEKFYKILNIILDHKIWSSEEENTTFLLRAITKHNLPLFKLLFERVPLDYKYEEKALKKIKTCLSWHLNDEKRWGEPLLEYFLEKTNISLWDVFFPPNPPFYPLSEDVREYAWNKYARYLSSDLMIKMFEGRDLSKVDWSAFYWRSFSVSDDLLELLTQQIKWKDLVGKIPSARYELSTPNSVCREAFYESLRCFDLKKKLEKSQGAELKKERQAENEQDKPKNGFLSRLRRLN